MVPKKVILTDLEPRNGPYCASLCGSFRCHWL